MKKFAIVTTVMVALIAGFLYYDWHKKTHVSEEERYTLVYSWTDEEGQVNFTNQAPPAGAKNIDQIKTLKTLEKPIILQVTESVPRFIHRTRTRVASMTLPDADGFPGVFTEPKEPEGPMRSISSSKRQGKPLSRSRKS